MENQIKSFKAQALAKKKSGDIRGATLALKKMKMCEGEITKLDGQQMMLEQQKMTIQSTLADKDVIESLKQGNKVTQKMQEGIDADDLADLQDDMAETEANRQEIADMFTAVAEEGKDELLDELNQIEAEALEDEIGDLDPLANDQMIDRKSKIIQPVAATASDDMQMAQLAAGMNMN